MKSKFVFTERIAPRWYTATLPLIVVAASFVLSSSVVLAAGANPVSAFYYLLVDPLSTRFGLLEVLVSATPLLLTGTSVALAFRSGYWNIGAEGQLLSGAIAAAWVGTLVGGLPRAPALGLMIVAGMVAGGLWALGPALLRVKLGIDEVVTTLLLNPVAALLVSGLLNGPWRDPVSGFPESERIAASAELPQLVARSRVHLGFVLALVVVALGWFITRRTVLGVKMTATGLAPQAAAFAGIDVARTLLWAAVASGAVAGLAGVTELAGIQFRLTEGISPGYGYTGIVVATMGGLSMAGVALAAPFFAIIGVGANTVSRALGVPSQLGEVIQGTLLLVTVAALVFRRWRLQRVG